MQTSDDPARRVTLIERINGWWVQEDQDDAQSQLHGPYPDEETARSETALLGGADHVVAVTLPEGDHLADPGAREGCGAARARDDA